MANHIAHKIGNVIGATALYLGRFLVFIDELVGMGEKNELPPVAQSLPIQDLSGKPVQRGGNTHKSTDIRKTKG